jgi:hypothetical protein
MSELKTRQNEGNVEDFLNSIEDERKRKDAFILLEIMKTITGEEPKMWGPSIVGFGSYHYKYDSGREGDWFRTGFSPRKQNLSLYIMDGVEKYQDLLARLGKHKIGKSCLYVNKLADVDLEVLREMIRQSMREKKMGEL